MYHVSARGVDERVINVHYYCHRHYYCDYYYYLPVTEDAPPQPQNVTVTPISSTALTVEWTQQQAGLDILTFLITYRLRKHLALSVTGVRGWRGRPDVVCVFDQRSNPVCVCVCVQRSNWYVCVQRSNPVVCVTKDVSNPVCVCDRRSK